MRRVYSIVFIGFVVMLGFCCSVEIPIVEAPQKKRAIFLESPTPWADSVLKTLTLEQQIGQLFMVPAYSNQGVEHEKSLNFLIDSCGVGGIIFMQGGPLRQATMTNRLQARTQVPLMLAMDAEWGLGMRLDSTISFPRQMALGAVDDDELVYDFGYEVGRQLKRLGIHVNFAPVIDVNNNPANPVIGNRSFGEKRERVAKKGNAYMRGMQNQGVLACAKHFPGHGDTNVDSHKDLPVILHDSLRLDSIELYPFKKLIKEGLGSVMIAHLYVPALDSTALQPSTLSAPIVTEILRDQMDFEGLVFTDAMTMQGIAKYFEPGEMDVKALLAGNDVLLFPGDVKRAISAIKVAVESGELSEAAISEKCRRILKTKEWCGLSEYRPIELEGLFSDLNEGYPKALHEKLIAHSITVVKNEDDLLPIGPIDSLTFASLTFGGRADNEFTRNMENHIRLKTFRTSYQPNFSEYQKLSKQLAKFDVVFVNCLKTSNSPSKNYNITEQAMKLTEEIARETKVILNLFATPYALASSYTPEHTASVVVAYHDNKLTQKVVAEIMVGADQPNGTLPVSVGNLYTEGFGIVDFPKWRLKKSNAHFFDLETDTLNRIDSIALNGIAEGAYPGCRILAAKDGNVFYDKSFGNYTYDGSVPVNENTIYDLASITKILASTPSLMKMQDEGLVNVEYNLCDYLEICDTLDYYNINLREMLSHTAKLKAWIPFYLSTLDTEDLSADLYRNRQEPGYSTQVASGLYIIDSFRDSIMDAIYNTELRQNREYRYSDLGYYFIESLVKKKTETRLDQYADEIFYRPLGLQSMTYNPLKKFDKDEIAPTEDDQYFRKQLIQGHVHDPGAAMMGGVGGHAGLFSNAWDVAVMLQMMMDGGTYGGRHYLEEETIDYFTQCHFCDEDNRRGMGFDKPALNLDVGSSCNSASPSSFGHSGFTGTLAWADPDHDIVYVFLSNRIYPTADNRKLAQMNIRTDIQQVIYNAFGIPDRKVPE